MLVILFFMATSFCLWQVFFVSLTP